MTNNHKTNLRLQTTVTLRLMVASTVLLPVVVFSCMVELSIDSNPPNELFKVEFNSVQDEDRDLLSVVSCASCHGSHKFLDNDDTKNKDKWDRNRWKSAYQIWVSKDPHALAYRNLWNNRSKQIVSALANVSRAGEPASNDSVVDTALHQSLINDRCVSCHSTVPPDMSSEMSRKGNDHMSQSNLLMNNGVSCLSCHSNSELDEQKNKSWIKLHTKQDWQEGRYDKTAAGLKELADLNVRAQTCAKCHVGSKNRDVNHDLIAAGHPRLLFEYSSHLSRLPKHWNEKQAMSGGRSGMKDFSIECWSIGQIELAKSTLSLLKIRSSAALDSKQPWPEFAEYNCHNCHHGLARSWYQPNAGERLGSPIWGTWTFPSGNIIESGVEDILRVRQEMQNSFADATVISELTEGLAKVKWNIPAKPHLYSYVQRHPRLNSDEVYAWYLAVNCCLRDASDQLPEKLAAQALMKELWQLLRIPFDTNNEQQAVDAERLNQLIAEIRTLVLPMIQ